jgi:hypothetical protein
LAAFLGSPKREITEAAVNPAAIKLAKLWRMLGRDFLTDSHSPIAGMPERGDDTKSSAGFSGYMFTLVGFIMTGASGWGAVAREGLFQAEGLKLSCGLNAAAHVVQANTTAARMVSK